MKRFELIVGLIAILGIALKIIHIPGGGILIVLALSTLSVFYYVFSFAFFNSIRLRDIFKKVSYKGTNTKRIIGTIGLGYTLSTLIIGGLFKLQFWPGAAMVLMTGLVTTGIVLFIALIFYFRNKADTVFYTGVFKKIAIYGSLGLVLLITPSETLVDIFHGDNPDYAVFFKQMLAEPENLKNELIEKSKNIQTNLIYFLPL